MRHAASQVEDLRISLIFTCRPRTEASGCAQASGVALTPLANRHIAAESSAERMMQTGTSLDAAIVLRQLLQIPRLQLRPSRRVAVPMPASTSPP